MDETQDKRVETLRIKSRTETILGSSKKERDLGSFQNRFA
jgi:hypothetical protein